MNFKNPKESLDFLGVFIFYMDTICPPKCCIMTILSLFVKI